MGCGASQPADVTHAREAPAAGIKNEAVEKRNQALQSIASMVEEAMGPSVSRGTTTTVVSRPSRRMASTVSNAFSRTPSSARMSVQSENSQSQFRTKSQTLIILDWDDTLYPTYWYKHLSVAEKKGLKQSPDPLLAELRLEVQLLVELSQSVGQAILVTNSRRPWVEMSAKQVFAQKRLWNVLRSLPLFYALEFVDMEAETATMRANMVKMGQDPSHQTGQADTQKQIESLLVKSKEKAMVFAVTEFYKKYEGQSWKNVITIGDGFFEHRAIKKVVDERPDYTQDKKCRVKTVKYLEHPTLQGLVHQLQLTRSWIRKIIELDDDIDVEFAAPLSQLKEWHASFRVIKTA